MARTPDDYDDSRDEPRRRPRRRDDDEDDYDEPRRRPKRAGLDGMFLDTNMFFLVLFGVCCGLIAVILSIIELAIGKDPEAKRRATIVLIISIILTVIGNVMWFSGMLMQQPGVRRF